jgi:hypothetical protein
MANSVLMPSTLWFDLFWGRIKHTIYERMAMMPTSFAQGVPEWIQAFKSNNYRIWSRASHDRWNLERLRIAISYKDKALDKEKKVVPVRPIGSCISGQAAINWEWRATGGETRRELMLPMYSLNSQSLRNKVIRLSYCVIVVHASA